MLAEVNTVIAQPCDISFCLLEETSYLQFHGVNGTLNKLLFKNKGTASLTLSCRYHIVKECLV